MDFLNCMELTQAKEVIRRNLRQCMVAEEFVGLGASVGRITSEAVKSTDDLPPFARSTVDGYAVRSEDTFGACDSSAALFSVIGEIEMGQATTLALKPGEAAVIPTGGMLPDFADAVVMLEYTEHPDSQTLLVQKTVAPRENVIIRGEEATVGATVVEKGMRLSPQHIGLLAACGCRQIKVRKKIKVAVISSGDELVDVHETPALGQIRDVNSYSLSAMLSEMGCEVERIGIVTDSFDNFLFCLNSALQDSQMIVISGGSSVGAKDFTVPALRALGEPGVLVHGLAIKPGKPTIFGMAKGIPVFGLPGHPVAALTVCGQLVASAIRQMNGLEEEKASPGIPAVLTRNIASAPGRDDFIYVKLLRTGEGYSAEPVLGKSGLIGIMVQADGVVHIPSEKSGLYAGENIIVYPSRRC
ncbi:MAG: gephyrin-like molybdotransferase Glp [Negativicutes bacterium]